MAAERDAEYLAERALSESVTPGVLLGELNYYPAILPNLFTGEQPHYVALLTINEDLGVEIGDRQINWKTRESALVASEEYVRIISSNGNNVVSSYTELTDIELYGSPPRRSFGLLNGYAEQAWWHREAKTADDWIFEDTINFIRDMIRLKGPGNSEYTFSLEELRNLHRDGKISDAEFLVRRTKFEHN